MWLPKDNFGMKKLLFLFLSLALLFLKVSVVHSDEGEELLAAPPASVSSIPQAEEYTLPFPGLLPDSPFYFLKTSRDRMISFLISDPLKKAEFNILQADKRLNAGVTVYKKGKKEIAEETISKAENYFEEAIANTKLAKQQGMDVNPIIQKLRLASLKHHQVIESLAKTEKGDVKEKFETLKDRVATIQKDVEILSKQK